MTSKLIQNQMILSKTLIAKLSKRSKEKQEVQLSLQSQQENIRREKGKCKFK